MLIQVKDTLSGKLIKLDVKENHRISRILDITLDHMGLLKEERMHTEHGLFQEDHYHLLVLDGKVLKPDMTIGECISKMGLKKKDKLEIWVRLAPIEEEDWRNSVQYLYVIRKSGIVLYNQSMKVFPEESDGVHEDLLGSALSGISALVKEIVNNPEPIEVIKQQGYSILIEEGDDVFVVMFSLKDYAIIRKKLKAFLEEFEYFFEDVMDDNNVRVFIPTKKILAKHFPSATGDFWRIKK
ncbi:MAG: hypothetical protein ACFFCS_01750 [Candidatus Hodarchaeota archaeon]